MRLSAALKLLLVLVAALSVALVAAVKSMDMGRLKQLAAEQVLAATGRTLVVSGPLELRLGLVPRLIANGVSLSNIAGGSRPEMVTVERVEAEVALLPLLKREIRIQRLIVSAPDILLESDGAGHGNWSFPTRSPSPADAAEDAAPPVKNGTPVTRFTLHEVKIKNGRVAWRDGATGLRVFDLHKLTVQPDAGGKGALAVRVVGALDARMLHLDGRLTMPAMAEKPWGVHLQGSFDAIQAKIEGTVADPLSGRGVDLTVAAQGDELGKLLHLSEAPGAQPPLALGPFKLGGRVSDGHGPLAASELEMTAGRRDALVVTARGTVADLVKLGGVELALTVDSDTLAGLSRLTGGGVPSIGPLKAAGQLSGGGGHWKLADFKATLAGSDAAGELVLDVNGRPRLSGSLTSNVLLLADFITPASKPGEKLAPKGLTAEGDGRLFPAEPLSLAPLRVLDAAVTVRAGRVDLGKARLSELSAQVALADGRLSVRPVHATLAGGTVDAELSLSAMMPADAGAKGADLAVKVQGRGVDLGRLLKEGGQDVLAGGRSDLRLDLRGRGESWRALMASVSGESVLSVGEGRVHNTAIDWAAGDLLIQMLGVLNPLSRAEEHTPLSCAVVRFVVRDGVATADRGIAVETAKVNVVGSGTIDLRDERLDLGIAPRARDGIGLSLTTPLAGLTRVRGTLAEPALSLDELGSARTAASVGAAVATGGLSLLGEALFDRLTADDTPCRTALGTSVPAKPAVKGDSRKKAPAKTRKSRKQSRSDGGFLESLFGG